MMNGMMCSLPLKSALISRDDCRPPYNSEKYFAKMSTYKKNYTTILTHYDEEF